jgi:hypothetical protein
MVAILVAACSAQPAELSSSTPSGGVELVANFADHPVTVAGAVRVIPASFGA